MANNYTMQDVLGILRVFPVFSLVLFVPGYLIAAVTNILGFRRRGITERVLLALTLSCAVSPYAVNILCRFLSVRAVSILFLLLGIIFLGVVLLEWRGARYKFEIASHWTTKATLSFVAIWVLICLASLPDLELGQRIYSTVATYDHGVRSAFISSALRSGAPPANPFFYPGFSVNTRYYYYWNVLCAIPAFISGVSPRLVLYSSCIWSGLLFVSIIPIYLKHFLERRSKLRIVSVLSFALIAITGLDLIPTAISLIPHRNTPFPDMEWWDPVQITSWLDSLIWVPHHVASLIACLAAFLFLWKAVTTTERRMQIWLFLLAAIGFSSAVGLSVYVTFTFAVFVLSWVAYLLARRRGRDAFFYISAGLLALFISAPFIYDLLGIGSSGRHGSASFVAISPRQLPQFFSLVAVGLGHHNHLITICLQIIFGFVVLFFELGVYFVVGALQAVRDWKQRDTLPETQKALWFMVASTLMVIMLLRSTIIQTNDLAMRGALVLQFVLLLWTANYLADEVTKPRIETARRAFDRKLLHIGLAAMIVLGGAASLYQLVVLRTYYLLSDKYKWHSNYWMGTGKEAFSIRSAYVKLDRIVPFGAVVQYNPESNQILQMLLYSRYQQVDVGGPDCGTPFGGSLAECQIVQGRLKSIFDPDSVENLSNASIDSLCKASHINVLIVDAQDPIWKRADSWVWKEKPFVENDFVRMYRCGEGVESQSSSSLGPEFPWTNSRLIRR